jgi:hypothetical protein
MIEPVNNKALIPVYDELSDKVLTMLLQAEHPLPHTKEFHVCVCGQWSDNRDWLLPNGLITNSLAVHYLV